MMYFNDCPACEGVGLISNGQRCSCGSGETQVSFLREWLETARSALRSIYFCPKGYHRWVPSIGIPTHERCLDCLTYQEKSFSS